MRTINLLSRRAVVFALALAGTVSSVLGAPEPPDGTCKPEEIVAYAKRLSREKLGDYLDKLGKAKDFRALEAVYRSRFTDSSYAANVTVQILDSDKAVAFCASLDLGAPNWCDAVMGLRYHPKEKVIGYLKQTAATSDREARYMCYWICRGQRWDDLVPFAKRDVADDEMLLLSDLSPTETLGTMATDYIESLEKKK